MCALKYIVISVYWDVNQIKVEKQITVKVMFKIFVNQPLLTAKIINIFILPFVS
jgi:hypothetical protein